MCSKGEMISLTQNAQVDDHLVPFQPGHNLSCQAWEAEGSKDMLTASQFCLGSVATKRKPDGMWKGMVTEGRIHGVPLTVPV